MWLFMYLKGTFRLNSFLGPCQPLVDGYTNTVMSGDIDSNNSTLCYLVIVASQVIS